jgi:hypothetical protein
VADPEISFRYTPKENVPLLAPPPNLHQKSVSENETLHYEAFLPIQVPPWGWWTPECKPAIYLYPEKPTTVSVRLAPQGFITYSDPLYDQEKGWSVVAQPSGDLTILSASSADSKGKTNYINGQFPYLYYESKIQDAAIQKPQEGYVVKYQDLDTLYQSILPKLGLNAKETKEYITYWNRALPTADYYFVGVMDRQSIDSIEPLAISPFPATSIRVRLYYEGVTRQQAQEKQKTIQNPQLITPQRNGFTAVEWGGMVKQDKEHPFTCSM